MRAWHRAGMNARERDADRRAIRELVERANELQSDVEPFLALHTEDAVIVNLAGVRVPGRRRLGETMTAALGSRLGQVITRSEVDDVAFVRDDVAIVSCTKTVEDRNDDAPAAALPRTGRLTYVVVQDDGAWRIALAQTTPVLAG
jgi:uncharacterized protein (TIGR02246 family)